MRTNGTYRTPVHGVSTLAPRNRMRGQAGLQENFRSDPVLKLSRRPSTKFEFNVPTGFVGSDYKNSLFHSFTRGGDLYTYILYKAGESVGLPIYRLSGYINGGLKQTLNLTGLESVVSLKKEVKLSTVEDTTFILNKNTVVESIEIEDKPPITSYINILSALNYGEVIKIRMLRSTGINTKSITLTYNVPDLGDPPDYDTADKARATAAVAEALAELIQDIFDIDPSWDLEVYQKGSIVALKGKTDVTSILLEVATGQGDRSIVISNAEKQDLEGLPLYAVPESHIKVKPRPTSDRGTYYLKAEPVDTQIDNTDELEEVVWVETRSRSGSHKIDPTTMPRLIKYTGLTFEESLGTWEERSTGDDDTNKLPEFVGKRIADIGSHQNRLVLTANNFISMSRTDNLFNFFKESAIRLVVSDPINIKSAAKNVDKVEHIVPHNRDLMFVSRNAQFKLDGNVAATPETVAIPQVTAYNCQMDAAPVAFGNAVLFPITYGYSSGVLIYNKDAQVESDKATQLTNHVQGYIEGTIISMKASSTLEMAVVISDQSGENELFVYEQYTEFDEARQRSWSKWKLPENTFISDAEFIDNKLRLLVVIANRLQVWFVELNSRVANDNDKVYLDNSLVLTVEDDKRVTLPSGYFKNNDTIAVFGNNAKYPLTEIHQINDNPDKLNFQDDEDVQPGDEVIIGLPFTSRYVPTRPFRWTEAGIVVTTDKLRISRFTLSLVDTAEVSMRILSDYYDDYVVEYKSRLVGGLNNLVGVQPFTTGDVQFSFGKEADLALPEFYTEGYLPLTIAGISWFGQYHEPSRRM